MHASGGVRLRGTLTLDSPPGEGQDGPRTDRPERAREAKQPRRKRRWRSLRRALSGLSAMALAALMPATTPRHEHEHQDADAVPGKAPVASALSVAGKASANRRAERMLASLERTGAETFVPSRKAAAFTVAEHRCLTEALYYEARGESVAGRLAVGEVIVNRVRDTRFPDTICGVVNQGGDRSHGCQFSYNCDGSTSRAPDPAAWRDMETEALHLLLGLHRPSTFGATHYHADYVTPGWASQMVRTARIGSHLFYRPAQGTRATANGPAG